MITAWSDNILLSTRNQILSFINQWSLFNQDKGVCWYLLCFDWLGCRSYWCGLSLWSWGFSTRGMFFLALVWTGTKLCPCVHMKLSLGWKFNHSHKTRHCIIPGMPDQKLSYLYSSGGTAVVPSALGPLQQTNQSECFPGLLLLDQEVEY